MDSVEPGELAASLQRFGLERDRLRAAIARTARISETDLDALEHLEADGPLTQRELGARLLLTSGAITMLVDRLERAGWVHRRPHPTDRRATLLELSAQAAEREPEPLSSDHGTIAALAAAAPAAERGTIHAFLQAAAGAASDAAARLVR